MASIKWVLTSAFLVLFVPLAIWPWSSDVILVFQGVLGAMTLYIWSLDLSKRGKIHPAPLIVIASCVTLIWVVTIPFPAIYNGNTFTYGIWGGQIHVYAVLGIGPEAEALSNDAVQFGYFETNAPSTHQMGSLNAFRVFIFSLLPRMWLIDWDPPYLRVRFPLWVFLVLALVPLIISAISMRWFRRTINPDCVSCGYDLTSNTSGICPECGRPIPEEQRRAIDQLAKADSATASP